jgi:hypothetical protein
MPRPKLDKNQETIVLSIRMPADLHAALSELAQAENRSLSQQVVYLLRQSLQTGWPEQRS